MEKKVPIIICMLGLKSLILFRNVDVNMKPKAVALLTNKIAIPHLKMTTIPSMPVIPKKYIKHQGCVWL